jgi:hypothetical protein
LFAASEKIKPKDKIFEVDNMLHAHGTMQFVSVSVN